MIGGKKADVDLNHLYTAGVPDSTVTDLELAGVAPRELLVLPEDLSDLSPKIGVIDSSIDRSHPAFSSSAITTRRFVNNESPPDFHGTAIASIILSTDPLAMGLAPKAEIFAAEVFDRNDEQGEFASTVSLIKALNWLVTLEVSESISVWRARPIAYWRRRLLVFGRRGSWLLPRRVMVDPCRNRCIRRRIQTL